MIECFQNYKIPSICSSAEPVDEQLVTPNEMIITKQLSFDESPINSSFVVNNAELAIPDGMEGPIPVYVKLNTYDYKTEATTNGLPDLTSTFVTEDQTVPTVQTEDEEPIRVH